MDRREFLLAAGSVGATWILSPAAREQDAPPRPRDAASFYVDGQGSIFDGLEESGSGRLAPTQRFFEAIRDRRIDLVCATVAPVGNGDQRFRDSVDQIAFWDRTIAARPDLLAKIESHADILAARAAGKLGFIYNFQDTVALEGDPDRVDTFATLGVKVMQLTYNKRNLAGDGCLERANAGLSDHGRAVVAKINAERVLLDLSHACARTQAEGIAASSAPAAISHSGCRALADLPRNTHDAEMRALARKGGVFGVYLMPFLRMRGQPGREDLLRHLDHAVNVCGEDHVSLGTDGPLFGFEINDETRARQRRFYEDRARRGIAAPGEAADVFNMVEGYNAIDRYDRIAADLGRRGWRSGRIEKLLGGNLVRLYREVWGA